MNPVALVLASHLLASPQAAPTSVFRPPVAAAGEFSNAELEALQGRVDDAFSRTEFASVVPAEPSRCTTTACWQSYADQSGSRYLASVSVEAVEADQRLVMSIIEVSDGSSVVELERSCELCGRDELLDATGDLCATALRKLQSHAAVTTAILVDSVPAGARVILDGRDVGSTPTQIEVSPGPHTVELSAAGYDPFSQAVEIDRGTTQSLRLRLSSSLQTDPAPAEEPPVPTRRRGTVVAGAALLGGGFLSAATGVTLIVLHGREIRSDCSGDNMDPSGNCHFLHDTRTGGILGLSAGAAALVGGAVLLGIGRHRGRQRAVALSPTAAGLLVHGRF